MLTVTAVDLGGNESVFEARNVIASRSNKKSDNFEAVECYDEKFGAIIVAGNARIMHGVVYVMNSDGQTVARYYLKQD